MIVAAPYNRAVVLSRDTTAEAERVQVAAWRRMSPLEKADLVSRATHDVLSLAMSGIRQRHPAASDRECFLRLAELQLGAALVRLVYADAADVLGPRA